MSSKLRPICEHIQFTKRTDVALGCTDNFVVPAHYCTQRRYPIRTIHTVLDEATIIIRVLINKLFININPYRKMVSVCTRVICLQGSIIIVLTILLPSLL